MLNLVTFMSRISSSSQFVFNSEVARSMQRFNLSLVGKASGTGTLCKANCVYKNDAPLSDRFLEGNESLFYVGNPHNYEFYSKDRWVPAMIEGESALLHNLEELFGGTVIWYQDGQANFEQDPDGEFFDWQLKVGSFVGFYTQTANGKLNEITEDQMISFLGEPAERSHLFDAAYVYFEGIENPYDKDGKYIFALAKPVIVLYKKPLLFTSKKLKDGVTAGVIGKKNFKPISSQTKAAKISSRTEKKDRYRQSRAGNNQPQPQSQNPSTDDLML